MDFFREHSGYVVGRRAEGAFKLARAECAAEQLDWKTTWTMQHDADLSWLTPHERKHVQGVYCASTIDQRDDYQSTLCGIVDPSNADMRVIEASLALEAGAYKRLQRRR